jgi:hypothetical protein
VRYAPLSLTAGVRPRKRVFTNLRVMGKPLGQFPCRWAVRILVLQRSCFSPPLWRVAGPGEGEQSFVAFCQPLGHILLSAGWGSAMEAVEQFVTLLECLNFRLTPD